jgi:hypothetical protein
MTSRPACSISSTSPAHWSTATPVGLMELVGDRATDRLLGASVLVEPAGSHPDRRAFDRDVAKLSWCAA